VSFKLDAAWTYNNFNPLTPTVAIRVQL